jgi:erythromycin esterase
MNPARGEVTMPEVLAQIRSLARPLSGPGDLDAVVDQVGGARFVGIGEASHGTHEFYRWRGDLSRRLIDEHGFTWIGVEGDWPDCWRINRWVRGHAEQHLDARGLLDRFERWPTWMWANQDVAGFLDWLRGHNLARPEPERVGFYGLDVYSLWDSLRRIIAWLATNAPDALPDALRAWRCFVPYGEDPQRYAWSTRLVPESCETDVVALLLEVRRQASARAAADEDAFDAVQNAEVAADAEHYYRIMVRGDQSSWNIRDEHMMATVDRIVAHLGPASKGLVWAHNTHIGDARATDMAEGGMINIGQLLRERHSAEGVALVGFAGHRGTVLAAAEWGVPERVLPVPGAVSGSHEDFLHRALGRSALLVFGDDRTGPWLSSRLGHRAIGVVYQPQRERGNYVPTRMGARYDALLWFEETGALRPLHHEAQPADQEFETEPTGF